MRMIIGFLLYWFSMHGYYMLLIQKFKVKKEFVFAITSSLLIIILFIAAILNMLFMFSILIFYGGLISYLYLSKNKLLNKKFFKSFFDYKYFILLAFVLYFTIVCFNLKMTHYDNFSHWALLIKQFFLHDTLGSFKYSVDMFTSYPPGSALFIYYFGLIFSKTESAMLIGQAYLNLAFISSIMALFNDKKKVISSIIFVFIAIAFSVVNIKLNELLVDTMLGLIGITTFIYTFVNRNDCKKCFMGLTIFSLVFLLIKNSGIIFIIVNAFLLFLVLKRNKKVKEGRKYIIYMLLITISCFLIWEKHLSMVYPSDDGYTSKHSISVNNVGRNILRKGPDKILEILDIYFERFIDLKNNTINHYLIILNLFLSGMAWRYKKNRKNILKSLLLLDVLAFLYYIALGAMYIISMPYDEALYLACFDRYMLTLIVTLMGILIINIYYNLNSNNINNKYFVSLFMIFLGLIIANSDYGYLIGFDNYNDSSIKEADKIYSSINLDEYKEDNKIFYLNNKDNCTFYRYSLRYLYFDQNLEVVCKNFDYTKYDNDTLIVIPDKDEHPFNKDNEKYFSKINDNLYRINNK